MHRPANIAYSEDVHRERLRALDSIRTVPADRILDYTVRGQYAGYTDEVENPDSSTETFAALKLTSTDERWQNVPIYVQTGKALREKSTMITMTFASERDASQTNELVFAIQPNERITLQLRAKKPGFDDELQEVPMEFSYKQVFDAHGHPDAYERVLVDSMRGDNTLFATSEEVVSSWRIVQPVLDYWAAHTDDVVVYEKGSDGPSLERIQQ